MKKCVFAYNRRIIRAVKGKILFDTSVFKHPTNAKTSLMLLAVVRPLRNVLHEWIHAYCLLFPGNVPIIVLSYPCNFALCLQFAESQYDTKALILRRKSIAFTR